jgi:hypothetical protein
VALSRPRRRTLSQEEGVFIRLASNSGRRPKNKEHMIGRSERNKWIRGAMKGKHHLGPRSELREPKLRFGLIEICLYCLTDLSQTIRCSHFADLSGNNTNTFILQSEYFRCFIGSIIVIHLCLFSVTQEPVTSWIRRISSMADLTPLSTRLLKSGSLSLSSATFSFLMMFKVFVMTDRCVDIAA